MTGESAGTPFWALATFLDQAKQRVRVVEMLDADYPLTKEDKAALAVGIRRLGQDKTDLMHKRTKHDPRRKRSEDPWSFHQAVKDVREFAAAAEEGRRTSQQQGAVARGIDRRVTQRDVLDVVALFWRERGQDFEQYRARVMNRLHIT